MPKKKIIIAGPLPPPYFGVSNATKITLEGLKEDFDILHLDTSDRREEFNFGKYDFHNIFLGLKSLFDCTKLLSKNPDILYIPISQSYPAYYRDAGFILLGRFFGKKIILHLRGGYFRNFYENEKGIRKFILRNTISKADKIIVLGSMLRKIFKNIVSPDKIEVISNGVDTDTYYPDYIKRPRDTFRICFISNFESSKGWRELLDCALMIKEDARNIKYEIVMAGKWRCTEEKLYAEDFIRNNGIEDVVRISDSISGREKVEFLQSSHLFVMPTSYKYEGQPWAIIEAMACGMPVISSPQGCIEETVIDGRNGFIIRHNNIKEMKSLIIRFIEDNSLTIKMGEESRKLAIERFSEKNFLKNLKELYNRV